VRACRAHGSSKVGMLERRGALVKEVAVPDHRPDFGLVTALPVECAAMRLMVDDLRPAAVPGDDNLYDVGLLPSSVAGRPHRVVLALQAQDGTRHAAAVATHLVRSFPTLRHVVMSGIAGGIPVPADGTAAVRLGDVVTAAGGIVDYGHLRLTEQGARVRRPVDGLSKVLLRADRELATRELLGNLSWHRSVEEAPPAFRRPEPGRPRVHRTVVGSADLLLRHAAVRDDLADGFGVRAVEMEGSGIAAAADLHGLDWYMVRGVADYADAVKADRWHGYAALVAAAYTRMLLSAVPPAAPAPPRATSGGLGALVEALLALPVMRDDLQRRAVLGGLPDAIRTQIPDHQVPRLHVLALVQTCQRFTTGDQALLDALELVLGRDSAEWERVAAAVARHWTGDHAG
jgi:nucleoside phosphorylase